MTVLLLHFQIEWILKSGPCSLEHRLSTYLCVYLCLVFFVLLFHALMNSLSDHVLVTKVHFTQKASFSKEALPILDSKMLIKIRKLLITYFFKKNMRKLSRVRNGRACQIMNGIMNFRYHLAYRYSNPHVCLFVFLCLVSISNISILLTYQLDTYSQCSTQQR